MPDGYYKDGKGGRGDKSGQLSLYEMHQKRTTGFTKEDHQEIVTDAWRASDNPKAFVQALADKGYLLATGKRPYVLVDYYGDMHALPKMIADKTVRTKDIREFLEKDYPPESLPSVDQARDLIAKHRAAIKSHANAESHNKELSELKQAHKSRRTTLEKKKAALQQKHRKVRQNLATKQRAKRDEHRSVYLAKVKLTRERRHQRKLGEFARSFSEISGFLKLRSALRKYQDIKRLNRYQKIKAKINEAQSDDRLSLARRQVMGRLDMQRKLRSLSKLEKRELKSFEELMNRESRIQERGGRDEMPSLILGNDNEHKQKEQSSSKIRRYGHSKKRDNDKDHGR